MNGVDRRRFLAGAAGATVVASSGIASVGSVASRVTATPEKRWQREFGSPGPRHTTVGDAAVFASRPNGGNTDGDHVIGLAADSGEETWRFDAGDNEVDRLAVTNEILLAKMAHDDSSPSAGIVIGLDPTTGEEVWRVDTTTTDDEINSLTVADDVVYAETWNGSLYALDAATGTVQWRFHSESLLSNVVRDDGIVFAKSYDGLHAVDAETGEETWYFSPDVDLEDPQLVADGTVYVGGGDTLFALDATTGERAWQFDASYRWTTALLLVDGTVIASSVKEEMVPHDGAVSLKTIPTLYAIDARTGEERWRRVDSPPHPGSLSVVGDTLLVRDRYSSPDEELVYGLEAATGNERWRFESEKELWFDNRNDYLGPLVDETLFYTIADESSSGVPVATLSATTGETSRYFTADGDVSELTAGNGILLVGDDAHLYALEVGGNGAEGGGDSGSDDSDSSSGDEPSDGEDDADSGDSGTDSPDDGTDGESGDSGNESPGGDSDGGSGDSKSGSEDSTDDTTEGGSDDNEPSGDDSSSDDSSSGSPDDGSPDSSDGGSGSDDSTGDGSGANEDGTPGMGIPAAITGLGGVGYVLKRRLERFGSDDP